METAAESIEEKHKRLRFTKATSKVAENNGGVGEGRRLLLLSTVVVAATDSKTRLLQTALGEQIKLRDYLLANGFDVDAGWAVEEGRFLRQVVIKEGIRSDPEKVQAIIGSPTPKGPNKIRSLFLQLTTIGKFIQKLVEVKYPINKVRIRLDATIESGWMNEAKEALQRIKRKLNNLQTLAIPNEGEEMMLCMQNKMISSILMVEREEF
uniref:Protein NYNRIN-like n=1 Tax=Tanacetum cinerariifolium TaxID=118510 RepID=A0A699HQ31_TANCI|nr:protein NYNRIN-like [Tanacetum cinerariifolium]